MSPSDSHSFKPAQLLHKSEHGPTSSSSAALEDHLSPFLDLASTLFMEVDAQGNIVFLNEYALRLLDWKASDLIGKNWLTTCVPEDAQAWVRSWFSRQFSRKTPEQRIDFEMPVLTRSGTSRRIRWIQLVLKQVNNQAPRLLACGHDVTNPRNAEASLDLTLRELRIYKFALDASSIVAITNQVGRIIFANEKFCSISQYSRDELLGENHSILNSRHHPKSFFIDMWKTISSGSVWRADIKNRAKDGSYYWVDTTIVPVVDIHTQKPIEYIAIRNDISRRKEIEVALEQSVQQLADANQQLKEEHQKLLQAEKMASVGILAAGVAHEINNPLSGVMACIKALDEGTVRPERREQYFATARDGLERIQQTVRGLLDFSRQRAPSQATLALSPVIDACIQLVLPHTRKHDIQIHISSSAALREVYADRSQLMQSVVNLLLNAIYVSPPHHAIECDVVETDLEIGIRISDFGPGMSDEVITRACDPFYSTKPEGEGTGLGLAVTQSIAQAHQGRLDFERRVPPTTGTHATFWLPKLKD